MGWLEPCHYYQDRRQEAGGSPAPDPGHYLMVIIRVRGNEVSPTLHFGIIYLENRHTLTQCSAVQWECERSIAILGVIASVTRDDAAEVDL